MERSWRDGDLPTISGKLFTILDVIGLSDTARQVRVDNAAILDIVENITCRYSQNDDVWSTLFMGSAAEATSTTITNSHAEKHLLFRVKRFATTQVGVDYVDPLNEHLRIVEDANTPPGYVKLVPLYRNQVGSFFPNIASYISHHTCTRRREYIHTYLSPIWPPCYYAYLMLPLTRSRPHNWPSEDTVTMLQQYGCFMEAVGHPTSAEHHILWRKSYSLQERHLMLTLNPCQYKCYVLVKLVNKFTIIPQYGSIITSYHCKTALFWTIENTPASMWVPGNLIECLLECLSTLRAWVEEGNCPNYFNPSENMFEGRLTYDDLIRVGDVISFVPTDDISAFRLTEENKRNLVDTLSTVVQENGRCLLDVGDLDLGARIRRSFAPDNTEGDNTYNVAERWLLFHSHFSVFAFLQSIHMWLGKSILKKIANVDSVVEAYDILRQIVFYINTLQQITFTCCLNTNEKATETGTTFRHFGIVLYHLVEVICAGPVSALPDVATVISALKTRLDIPQEKAIGIEYTAVQVKKAIRIFKPFIQTRIASNLMCLYRIRNKQWMLDKAAILFKKGVKFDALASISQYAAAQYCLGTHRECERMLSEHVQQNIGDNVSFCCCYVKPHDNHDFCMRTIAGGEPVETAIRRSVCGCVIYLPTESCIAPPPVIFEMYRSFGHQATFKLPMLTEDSEYWFRWAVIDSRVYFHFLQYLIYRELNNLQGKANALTGLNKVISEDPKLGHRETGLNLLGWIYQGRGWTSMALDAFRRSLEIRPLHNAARWHLMFLLFR